MGKELKQKIRLFFAGEESSCILHILKVQSEKSNTLIFFFRMAIWADNYASLRVP